MSVARLPAVARIRTSRAFIRYHLVGELRLADTLVDASFRSASVYQRWTDLPPGSPRILGSYTTRETSLVNVRPHLYRSAHLPTGQRSRFRRPPCVRPTTLQSTGRVREVATLSCCNRIPARKRLRGYPRHMDLKALESTIARIPGVENVRIVAEGNKPREVHVLATPGKPAKQLVRDVQSVAMAAFDLDIDRRIISVVQIDGGDLSAGDRPVVEDVSEEIDGSRMRVAVTLRWHDEKLTGSAQGPAASTTRMRLVAEATLVALEQALDENAAFAISAEAVHRVGAEDVAIVQVVLVIGGRERMMVGSALVGTDPSQAMVRAVLDAVNRQVPGLRRP